MEKIRVNDNIVIESITIEEAHERYLNREDVLWQMDNAEYTYIVKLPEGDNVDHFKSVEHLVSENLICISFYKPVNV